MIIILLFLIRIKINNLAQISKEFAARFDRKKFNEIESEYLITRRVLGITLTVDVYEQKAGSTS